MSFAVYSSKSKQFDNLCADMQDNSQDPLTIDAISSREMEMAVALVDESKTEKKARLERLIMDRDSLQLEHDNLVQMKVFSELKEDFCEAIEFKNLELAAIKFKHQILQANYNKLHQDVMENFRREKEDKEQIKSLFEQELQDVHNSYEILLLAKDDELQFNISMLAQSKEAYAQLNIDYEESILKVQELQQLLMRAETLQRVSDMAKMQNQQRHDDVLLQAVEDALEPVNKELDELRKDRQALLELQIEHQELKARIEPFMKQLEGYEAEKAQLLTNYTRLIGHTNPRQKIQHLTKLKDDILDLRKELDKEKKLRQKAEAKVKELSLPRNKRQSQDRQPFRELQ